MSESATGRLQGKLAVVTGGTTGIGEAIVRRFAAEGAAVSFCARNSERGERLAGELQQTGVDVEFLACDAAEPEQVSAWIDGVAERHGHIDIVVNNAGIGPSGPLEKMALEDWETLMRINVTGMFLVCRAAIPHLRAAGGGSIINVSSICAYIGMSSLVPYGVTKAAALSMAKGLALELAGDRIRVNAVCPGTTLTPATASFIDGAADPDALQAALAAAHPIGRLGTAEEQAAAVAFLASQDASFITGHGLLVDGGYTAQ